MFKPNTEQMEKLKATIRTLYQLEDELSSNFEGSRQDAWDVHSILKVADHLTVLCEKWKENK